jgi:hypothetical protein
MLATGTLLVLAGCTSDQQILDSQQPAALDTALTRAKFDMSCPAAEPTVLSRGLTQPALVGPRFGGFPRAIYTIGVTGCGQKRTYNVTCNDETTCFAGDGS